MCCVCHLFPALIGEAFCGFCLEDLRILVPPPGTAPSPPGLQPGAQLLRQSGLLGKPLKKRGYFPQVV